MNQLARTRELIERGIATGLHTGAQVYTSIGARPSGELAVGEARPGVPMTSDTLVLWLSSSKPVAAIAIMQLVEHGRCKLDDPVDRHLPGFGANGKQAVTIRHLLTHTCGFRWVDLGGPETPWDEILKRIEAAPLEADWIPGQKAGYHPQTSWYVLGELVRRLDGRTYSDYVRREIFEPLGMNDCWIGMPRADYERYGTRIAPMPITERPGAGVNRWSTETGVLACSPGANGHGPARELARMYEMFLGHGTRDGVTLLSHASAAAIVGRQRIGMFDETFRSVIDWGLGVLINSAQYGKAPYGYGTLASADTYGHSGSQSSAAFADPKYRLAVAIVLNGMPGEAKHQVRMRPILQALYEDLGLGV
ncbi:MAG TPA: serine hydrolase domain-containing protein [Pirellulales bacterium]|nr:serine hydrolase domain-containing protein [Pirellulales bacterium]